MDNSSLQIQLAKKQCMKVVGRPLKIGDYHQSIASINYDPEGRVIAVGSFDGSIRVFNAANGKSHTVLQPPSGPDDEPISVSGVKWRPTYAGGQLKTSTILASIQSNGLIQHWSTSTNKAMQGSEISTHRDKGNSLNVMDYTCDGKKLIVAGEDRMVHVYDDQSCQLITSMHDRGFKVPGHKNRIFALRAHPENFNVVVSGGWDGSVKIYDIRDKAPVGSIGGPQCSGDSIDVFDDMIVSGSTRNKNVMQMFSLSQMKKIHTWDFNSATKDVESGYVLATRFSNDGNFIFAGGAGKNEIRVYMNNCDSSANYKLQMEIKDLPSAVFTIDVNPNPDIKQFVFGCSNGQIIGINYDVDMSSQEFEPYQYNFNRVAYEIIAAEELAKRAKKRVSPLNSYNKMERFGV